MAKELMRGKIKINWVGAGGDNVQIAIDLHGIGIDHHAADFLGQRQAEGRLAARGGPCNKDGVKFHGFAFLGAQCLF